jgi:hypothetical protein
MVGFSTKAKGPSEKPALKVNGDVDNALGQRIKFRI